jgi:hypothetical protein
VKALMHFERDNSPKVAEAFEDCLMTMQVLPDQSRAIRVAPPPAARVEPAAATLGPPYS